MIKVEKSVVIARPIEEVFDYVSDLANAPRWQSGLIEAKRTTEGPIGVGTKYSFVRKFVGRKIEESSEFVAYEPNRLVTFAAASGPLAVENTYFVEPAAGGTKLTSKMKMSPAGLFGLAEPIIAASLRREMEAAFGELKDLLETRAVTEAA